MTHPADTRPLPPNLAGRPHHWISRADKIAVVLICAAVFAAFWNGLLDPVRLIQEDIATEMEGLHAAANQQIREGRFPHWNMHAFAGTRLYADIHLALFYPGSVLFRVLPFAHAVLWTMIAHYAATALATYAVARVILKVGPPAAAFAGLAFALSGFCLGHSNHLNFIFAYPYWPLLLLAIHEVHRHRGARAAAWWTVGLACIAFSVLSGGTPVLMLALMAAGWLTAVLTIRDLVRGDWGAVVRLALLLALMGACAFGLTAFQLLPTMDLYANSARVDWDQKKRFERAMPWRTLFYQLLAPGTLGSLRTTLWGRVFHEMLFFAGGTALPFAALAIVCMRRRRWAMALVVLLAVSTAMTVGFTPLLRLIDGLVVGVKLRLPARYVGMMHFSLVLLAAIGLNEWWHDTGRRRFSFAAAAGLVASLAMIVTTFSVLNWVGGAAESTEAFWAWYKQQPKSIHPWLSGSSATAFANVTTNRTALLTISMAVWCAAGGIVFLAAMMRRSMPRAALALVLLWAAAEYALFAPNTWAGQNRFSHLAPNSGRIVQFLKDNLGRDRYSNPARHWPVWRNRGVLNGLAIVDGYAGSEMNISREQITLMRKFELMSPDVDRRRPAYPMQVLSLFSARYLLVNENGKPAVPLPEVLRADGVIVHENANRMPPAAFLPEVRVADGLDATLAMMDTPEFDPHRFGIVYDAKAWPHGRAPEPSTDETCEITEWSPGRVAVQANCRVPRLLFVGVSYDAGWRVTVDGRPVEPIRLDACLNAVPLEAGRHAVRFTYTTPKLLEGIAVSAGTAAAMLAFLVVSRILRRPKAGGLTSP